MLNCLAVSFMPLTFFFRRKAHLQIKSTETCVSVFFYSLLAVRIHSRARDGLHRLLGVGRPAFGSKTTTSTLPVYKNNMCESVGISYYVSSNLICSKRRYQVTALIVLRRRGQIRKLHIRNVFKLFLLIFMFNAIVLTNVSALLTF
jgi:hypothetical protein